MKKRTLIILFVMAMCCGFVGCTGQDKQDAIDLINDLSYMGDRTGAQDKRNNEKDAYEQVKSIFKEKILDCPSTAVFPAYEDRFVEKNSTDKYTVTAYVDAQNLMGAMVRTKYSVVVTYDRPNDMVYFDFIYAE